MIKVKSKSYQGTTVNVLIEFDLGASIYERNVSAQISQVLGMTVDHVKNWVIGFVNNQRKTLQEQSLDTMFNQLIGVDLEE